MTYDIPKADSGLPINAAMSNNRQLRAGLKVLSRQNIPTDRSVSQSIQSMHPIYHPVTEVSNQLPGLYPERTLHTGRRPIFGHLSKTVRATLNTATRQWNQAKARHCDWGGPKSTGYRPFLHYRAFREPPMSPGAVAMLTSGAGPAINPGFHACHDAPSLSKLRFCRHQWEGYPSLVSPLDHEFIPSSTGLNIHHVGNIEFGKRDTHASPPSRTGHATTDGLRGNAGIVNICLVTCA